MPRSSKRSDAESPPATRKTEDEMLLAPPVTDRRAFTHTDPWRVLRIMSEFVQGFDALADVHRAVTIFGSARVREGDSSYRAAVETARRLGEAGYTIVTGGGPGIMEAANRGAREAGALSVGLNIELPHEQHVNPWVDREIDFRYFFVRKTMFVKYSCAFVVFPGGFGTLDEMFEALTLIQTEKVSHFAVVLVSTEYWSGLTDWIRERLLGEGKIAAQDMDLLHVTDDPAEVVRIIRHAESDGRTGR